MSSDRPDPIPVAESWDTYWQGAHTSAAFTGGGTTDPVVLSFWEDYFQGLAEQKDHLKIIDIASGNGALSTCARTVFGGQLPDFTCLDVSPSAILMIQKRYPEIHGIVADAAKIPLDTQSFDVVTSQFGIEYAGLDALDEIARLVAPGGELALMLHYRDGVIDRECSVNFDAIREMQATEFIPRCMAMFEAAFDALQGGNPTAYQEAGKEFAPAIKAMESIMARYGSDVAANTVLQLYRDVRTIHESIRNYEASDVIDWLTRMDEAVEAYAGRMASMCDVAIDDEQFGTIRSDLVEQQFEIARAEPLARPGQELPLAWILIARRG